MSALQTAETLARQNGFNSFDDLLQASRYIPTHGPAQFLATSPHGVRFLWGADDLGSDYWPRPANARGRRASRRGRKSSPPGSGVTQV